MNSPIEKKTSIEELLSEDSPEGYCGTLSSMYEAWIGSDHSSGTSADQRALVLNHFKALRRFLFRLQKEEIKKKSKVKKKDLLWLG